MKMYIGSVLARCPTCSGDDWVLREPARSFTVLAEIACGQCGRIETYADLALKMGDNGEISSPGASIDA